MITRITNSMLTGKMMSNLYTNLTSLSKLQNQLASGRKYAHISDDPAALIYGQAARNKLSRLGHFQAAVGTAQKWNVQTEAGIMELQKSVGNIYEELINAGGERALSDRNIIAMNVSQIRDHFLDSLNSSFGDRFVFAGYNTPGDYVDRLYNQDIPQGTIKPFTFDGNASVSRPQGNLLFNGLNISQFDGMPVSMLNVTSVKINVGGVETRINVSDLWDMDPADPVRIDAEAALMAEWEKQVIGPPGMRDVDGNLLYPDGIVGTPGDPTSISVFNTFGPGADMFTVPDPTPPDTPMTMDDILFLHKMMSDVISLEVGPGIEMPVTINGLDVLFFPTQDRPGGNQIMRNMYEVLNEAHGAINGDLKDPNDPVLDEFGNPVPDPVTGLPMYNPYTVDEMTEIIKLLQDGQNHLLVKTAEIGGRDRRLELLESRYEADEINYNQMRSDAEDADIAEVIMHMKLAETVYQAALSAGARVIQPTLMDFLR